MKLPKFSPKKGILGEEMGYFRGKFSHNNAENGISVKDYGCLYHCDTKVTNYTYLYKTILDCD